MTWIERVRRDEDVRDLVSLALVEARGIVPARADALDLEIERAVEDLRTRYAGRTAGEIPHLRPARALYRAIGIDPTKRRPSPEALLRRLLRGAPFPRVHPAVDLGNLWAILSGFPVGLYDTARIAGEEIVLRLGREGETYPGIRRPEIHLGGRLVLADRDGPFGNPSADSARTAVDETSRNLLYAMFAPTDTDIALLDRWAAWLRERVESHLGGRALAAVLP